MGSRRSTPLEIYGPDGVQDVVEGYSRAYSHDFSYRILHHGEDIMPQKASELLPKPFSIPEKTDATVPSESFEVYKDDIFRINTWEADHGPVKPAVSYRINVNRKQIIILGNTNYHPWMHELCKNADIIISNAISHDSSQILSQANEDVGRRRFAKITKDITNYHMNPIQAVTLAKSVNAKKLVLIHVTPPITNPIVKRRYLKGIKEIFQGSIILGEESNALNTLKWST